MQCLIVSDGRHHCAVIVIIQVGPALSKKEIRSEKFFRISAEFGLSIAALGDDFLGLQII